MSLDAGTISSEAQLDISQLQKASDQAVAALTRMTAEMGKIPTPKVALDTSQAQASIAQAQGGLQGLLRTLQGGLSGKVDLSVGDAAQNTAALEKTLQGLLGTVGLNTTALSGLTAVLGAGGLAAAAGVAVVGLAALGAEMKGFQRQIENTTGASGERLTSLQASFRVLFGSIPADGGAIGSALSIINQEMRLTGAPLESLVTQINAFTRVMGGDLATNTRQLVDVTLAWQVSAKDANVLVSDLAKLAQATGLSVSELTSSLTRNALTMQELGLNYKEGALLLDALGDAGLQPRLAMTALAEAANKAATSGAESTDAWGDYVQVIQAAGTAAEAAALGAEIFGQRAGPKMAQLIREGRTSVDDLVADLDNADDKLQSGFAQGTSAAAQFQVEINQLKLELEPTAEATRQLAAAVGLNLVSAFRDAQKSLQDFMGSAAVREFLKWQSDVAAAAPAGPLGLPEGRARTAAATLTGQGQGGGGSFDEGDLAKQAQAAQADADALETLTKQHNDLRQAQENVAAATAKATASLADQLKAAGANTALIESLLASAEAAKTLDSAITSLTDQGLAAVLVAMRNTAEANFAATGSWEQYDTAVALAGEHLAAQKATQDAATQAQREARQALDDVGEAYRKAGQVAEAEYGARVQKLADAVLPSLDTATATTLKQQLLLNDQFGALQTIAAATGIPLAQLEALLGSTGAAFDAGAKAVGAYSQSLAALTSTEQAARIESVFGGLSSAVDASTAALAKQQQQAGDSAAALQTLLQAFGVAPAAIDQLKTSLEAGGAAAFDAQEKIKALTTYVRDQSGQVRLKIDVDISSVQQSIQQVDNQIAQGTAKATERAQDYQGQQAKLAQQVAKSGEAYDRQVASINSGLTTSLAQIKDARTASGIQYAQDVQAATAAETAALQKIRETERSAAARHKESLQDIAIGLDLAVQTAAKAYADAVKTIGQQMADAIDQAASRAAAGLGQLSGAMTTFNNQQVQANFQAAVQANQKAFAQFAPSTGPGINVAGVMESNQQLASDIANAGKAGLTQQEQAQALARAQYAVAQQQLDATKALNKTMTKLAEQLTAAGQTQTAAGGAASLKAANDKLLADRALRVALQGQEYVDAATELVKAVVNVGGTPMVRITERVKELGTAGIPLGGTQGAKDALHDETTRLIRAAKERHDLRTKQLNDMEDRARERAEQALAEAEKAYQQQLLEFADRKAELARQHARDLQADAERQDELQRQKQALQHQLHTLLELKGLHDDVLKLQPRNTLTFAKVVNQETGVDFLAVAARQLITQGQGGL